jgi:hypothetical protein
MPKKEKVAKASYAQPKLNVYGSFSQLTASGSFNTTENGNSTNSGGAIP